MLLTLMMQVGMFDNYVPPIIVREMRSSITLDDGGAGNKSINIAERENAYHRRLAQDDEEVFEIIKMWFKCQN
jgi:hypothetical protein